LGTWGTAVDADDVFADIHDAFLDLIEGGASPDVASATILQEFALSFADSDETFVAHFALAYAQWEQCALDPDLLARVREMVESGQDLQNWRDRDAAAATVAARERDMERFLAKISVPRRRRRPRRPAPKVTFLVTLSLPAPDGRKALVVTETIRDDGGVSTSGMMQWARGGGAVFHVGRGGVQLVAEWEGSQMLHLRFTGVQEANVRFQVGPRDEAFFSGDRVALVFSFDGVLLS
jgi:hypothetical protein